MESNCDTLEAEIDELRREVKQLEKNESKLDSYKSRNNRLTELTSQWGGAKCTMAYRQSLQRLKEELRNQKNILIELRKKQINIRKKQINKFSPTTNNGKFGLWNSPYEPKETLTLNPLDYPPAESDDEFGGDEDVMVNQPRNHLNRYEEDDVPLIPNRYEENDVPLIPTRYSSTPRSVKPKASTFTALMDTFKTKAKSLFGKGGKRRRKKTRRKGK